MQDYNLKPCPFCGRSPDVYQAPETMILMGMPYFAGDWICLCLRCRQSAVGAKKYSDVVEKWNRRAPGWVSTKTAVPSDARLCVIATTGGMGVVRYFGEGAWIAAHASVDDEVTHWHEMPKEWIPASEKLPEEEGKYLVVRDDKICCLADYDGNGEWMTWDLCNMGCCAGLSVMGVRRR